MPVQTQAAPTERLTLTILEASRVLGIGRRQTYEAALRGEIPAVRVGRRVLVPRAALEQMLAQGGPRAED